jgi:hypothetical protein
MPTHSVVYKGDPKVETDLTKLEIGGKEHSVIVNKKTGAIVKDLGPSGEKPANVTVNQGTWSIQEDAAGNPIEYNSKTGETRPVAAGGVQKAGTFAKKEAAGAPDRSALQFATDYLHNGVFTGPKDEALQDQFFQLAKPSTGFRMNQAQIDQLHRMQSWVNSAQGFAYHAIHGTWFSPELRKDIVDAMTSLAKAKGVSLDKGGEPSGASAATAHYVEGTDQFDIPPDKVAAFEAKHPNAKRQ